MNDATQPTSGKFRPVNDGSYIADLFALELANRPDPERELARLPRPQLTRERLKAMRRGSTGNRPPTTGK